MPIVLRRRSSPRAVVHKGLLLAVLVRARSLHASVASGPAFLSSPVGKSTFYPRRTLSAAFHEHLSPEVLLRAGVARWWFCFSSAAHWLSRFEGTSSFRQTLCASIFERRVSQAMLTGKRTLHALSSLWFSLRMHRSLAVVIATLFGDAASGSRVSQTLLVGVAVSPS
ncbi:unnamed protein product [Sphagnum balticum]